MLFKGKQGSKYDMLLVGLGNPDKKYENTRHNAGFMVADRFCKTHGATLKRLKCKALVCECAVGAKRVLVAFPQTYMNLSGEAVQALCGFYKIPTDKLLIVFDDISLDVGNIRIRRSGSHGGHNGMRNISELMGTNEIARLKVGVGKKPHPDYDLKDWVLSRFTSDEQTALDTGLDKAVNAVDEILLKNIDSAMNKYNS